MGLRSSKSGKPDIGSADVHDDDAAPLRVSIRGERTTR